MFRVQSAGRGDLLFWGEKEGPTVVIWESQSEQERKVGWKSPARCTTGSCCASQKKGRRKSALLSSAGKEFFSNYDKTKSKEDKNKKNGSKKTAHRGQSVRYRS